MFWSKIASVYDLFENIYNRKVYEETGNRVAKYLSSKDHVLQCACGTGAISVPVAKKGVALIATDLADGMLKQARNKLYDYHNVTVEAADITNLPYANQTFDKVIAGNVIHLIPNPGKALDEMTRVCKPGGMLIIPTYINDTSSQSRLAVRFLEKLGATFKQQFDKESYAAFFKQLGYKNVTFDIVEGRMPCDIALIRMEG